MDHVTRAVLAFGSTLWQALDHAVTLLRAVHGSIRSMLDSLHVPQALQGGVIALLWVILLVSCFRALPVWGRFVLVFCTCLMLAKMFGGVRLV